MAGRSRGRRGCWTCLLRRKRCDGAHPSCRSCVTLEITCYGGETKPEWMDGASKQQDMAREVKARIRDGANGRRERRGRTRSSNGQAFVVLGQEDFAADDDIATKNAPSSAMLPTPILKPPRDAPPPIRKSILDLGLDPWPESEDLPPSLTAPGQAWEMDFAMMYLDYVFPFLFPFYRPPLVGTSRAWLLSFLKQNTAVFHSILGMSSFFFTVGLKDIYGEREPCKTVVWKQVISRADRSFEMIRKDLAEVSDPSTDVSLLGKAQLMETITQLLVFELFVSRSVDWNTHLTPALTLFEDIFETSLRDYSTSSGLVPVLGQMVWSRPPIYGLERPVWNPDQAAFRFFAAQLIFLDIIASTSFEAPPRLRHYHARLLADSATEEVTATLDLSAFVGCHNWVLMAIGDIAALDVDKKALTSNRAAIPPALKRRARGITRTLDEGLAQYHDRTQQSPDVATGSRPNRLRPYYHDGFIRGDVSPVEKTTAIWALAARIYVSIVAHGWVPEDAQVREDAAHLLAYVQSVNDVAQLHTLAWPICTAGCIATEQDQRQQFETITTDSGHFQLLGAVREAGRIMKAVWEKLDAGDTAMLDIAACLRILGTPALLV